MREHLALPGPQPGNDLESSGRPNNANIFAPELVMVGPLALNIFVARLPSPAGWAR